MKISEAASYVRSKNAGPFWVTVDIFLTIQKIINMLNPPLTYPKKLLDRTIRFLLIR